MNKYVENVQKKKKKNYTSILKLAGYTFHSWSLVIALITGRDPAPEWTERDFPLQTVRGQLTCEIALLHMDL